LYVFTAVVGTSKINDPFIGNIPAPNNIGGVVAEKLILVKLVQSSKLLLDIPITDTGIVSVVNTLEPENAPVDIILVVLNKVYKVPVFLLGYFIKYVLFLLYNTPDVAA